MTKVSPTEGVKKKVTATAENCSPLHPVVVNPHHLHAPKVFVVAHLRLGFGDGGHTDDPATSRNR
jgi:hypothetical protein